MCSGSSPKGAPPAPPPIEAPELVLETDESVADVRGRKREGRNQLRTGLQIPAPSSGPAAGVNIPG